MGPASLLRDRDYRLYLAGQSVSAVGDVITQTALPLLVLGLTGSATDMGWVGLLQSLPTLLVGLLAGTVADRWDRRRTMALCDVLRMGLVSLIPLAPLLGLSTMHVVYAVAFPLGVLHNLFEAAALAGLPALVGAAQIGRATALLQAASGLGFVVGPALAGTLASRVGPAWTLGLDGASFAVSWGTLALIRRPLQLPRPPRAAAPGKLWREMGEGLRFILGAPRLRDATFFWAAVTLLSAPLIPSVTYYVTVDLHRSPAEFGWVVSAFCVGMVAGALLGGRLSSSHRGPVMLASAAAFGGGLVTMVAVSGRAAQTLVAIAAGGALAVASVLAGALRAQATPDAVLGRVSSAARVLIYGLNPLALIVGGWLTDRWGGRRMLGLLGSLVALTSLGFAARSSLRRPEAG